MQEEEEKATWQFWGREDWATRKCFLLESTAPLEKVIVLYVLTLPRKMEIHSMIINEAGTVTYLAGLTYGQVGSITGKVLQTAFI